MSDADTTDEDGEHDRNDQISRRDDPSNLDHDSSDEIAHNRGKASVALRESFRERDAGAQKKRKLDSETFSTNGNKDGATEANAHGKSIIDTDDTVALKADSALSLRGPFLDGALRHSAVVDSPSELGIAKADLFLSDVAQKVLILCFFIDFDFLKTLYDPETSLDIVTDGALFTTTTETQSSIPPKWHVQTIAAKAFQCMHSKVFLIQYPGFMRIVVATSNLLRIDYDSLDNIFYIHDFPETSTPQECRFKTQLLKMYRDHMVESPLLAEIHHYDLSSCRVDLVVSIPGTYYGELEDHRYGQLALANYVSTHSPATSYDNVVTEHCSSSIGNLNCAWMQTFRNSFTGTISSSSSSSITPTNTKIIYASFSDVSESGQYSGGNGRPMAENMTCNGKWSDPLFPRGYFHRYTSRRSRTRAAPTATLYHAKSNVMYDADGGAVRWFLVGSHNYSQAAWGSVVVQGPRARYSGLKTVVANYEVSVLVPGRLVAPLLSRTNQEGQEGQEGGGGGGGGSDWRRAVTYRQETLARYETNDSPWTVRVNR